ncbi:MAG: hypothetical protein GY803_17185 [Chloroflexi bacterium]|nr:hypothetical protein [Chloroflexota bacterium]
MDELTQQGLAALKSGNKRQAYQLLSRAIQQGTQDARTWWALSFTVETKREQIHCLQQAQKLAPENERIRQQLAQITELNAEPAQPEPSSPVASSSENGSRLASIRHFLLDKPHLPTPLVLLTLFIIISEVIFILIGQTPGFWQDYELGAAFVSWITQILQINPFLFALISLAYLVIVGLVLRFLAYKPAIILWMIISFIHLRSMIQWGRCGLERTFDASVGSCAIVDYTLAIVLAGILGLALATTLWPRGSELPVTIKQKKKRTGYRLAVASASVWFSLLIVWLIWAISRPPVGWTRIAVDNSPSARAYSAIAYDTERNTAVLFGGSTAWVGGNWSDWIPENDTWIWDGRDWMEVNPPTSPSDRLAHGMAYDAMRGVVVLFGGYDRRGSLNDTWEWDGENWYLQSPTLSPPARCCYKMFYDKQRDRIVVYGGSDQTHGVFFNDVWEWDGSEWRQLLPDLSGPIASAHALAYDDDQNRAVILLSESSGVAWMWSGTDWEFSQLEEEPSQRGGADMVYDPENNQIVLFGGRHQGVSYDDTWLFDEEWQELALPRTPDGLYGHTLFYDYGRKKILLFGGSDGNALHNEMWELTLP